MEAYGILTCGLLRAYTGRTVCRISGKHYEIAPSTSCGCPARSQKALNTKTSARDYEVCSRRFYLCTSSRVVITLLRSSGTEEVTGFVHIGGDGDVEKTDHHFVVGLIAPSNCHVGIGIVGIIF